MTGTIDFAEFITTMRPLAVIFAPAAVPVLAGGDAVDQASLVKAVFSGRWPHMG